MCMCPLCDNKQHAAKEDKGTEHTQRHHYLPLRCTLGIALALPLRDGTLRNKRHGHCALCQPRAMMGWIDEVSRGGGGGGREKACRGDSRCSDKDNSPHASMPKLCTLQQRKVHSQTYSSQPPPRASRKELTSYSMEAFSI
ncbi:hypothetical protein MHYP_G00037280 [Metynnis hypsauchen]